MNNYCNAIFPRGVINRRNFHDVKMHNFVIVYSYETCSHTLHDYDIIILMIFKVKQGTYNYTFKYN